MRLKGWGRLLNEFAATRYMRWAVRRRLVRRFGRNVLTQCRQLTIVSFPNKLAPNRNLFRYSYVIEKIHYILGADFSQFSPFVKCNLAFDWQDNTFSIIDTYKYIEKSYDFSGISPYIPEIINKNCCDISKLRVGKLHRHIFGYDLLIDPTIYRGRVVCKSDENAAHDGEVIFCPISSDQRKPGKTYSRLIETERDGLLVDLRLVYIGGLLPVFMDKRSEEHGRFTNDFKTMSLRPLNEEFTEDEIGKLNRFAEEIGLEIGEMDVLRDQNTRRIYVVDVAKTPYGIAYKMTRQEKTDLCEALAAAYLERFLKPAMKRAEIL